MMGMFDSMFDSRNNEWQTKALRNLLDRYRVGDPVKLLLKDCQIEVLGGPRGRAGRRYATVRGGILMQVPDYRRPELTLAGYRGGLVEDEVPNVSVVSTEDELQATDGDDLVVNAYGHVWQRERGKDWWRSLHKIDATSARLADFGPFLRVRDSARLMDPETLAAHMHEAALNAGNSDAWESAHADETRSPWVDFAVAVLATPDPL